MDFLNDIVAAPFICIGWIIVILATVGAAILIALRRTFLRG